MISENVERTAKVGRTAPSRNLVQRNSNPEAFDKAIDDTCNTLRDLYNGVRITAIEFVLKVGQVLQHHYEASVQEFADASRTADTNQFLQQVAAGLQSQEIAIHENDLKSSMLIAARFTGEEIQQLAQTYWVNVTHLRQIAQIDDEQQRRQLTTQLLEASISTRSLGTEIKRLSGPRRAPGGGRPPKQHRGARSALEHIVGVSRQWLGLCEKSWFRDQNLHLVEAVRQLSRMGEIGNLPIEEAIDVLREVGQEAVRDADLLQAANTPENAQGGQDQEPNEAEAAESDHTPDE